MIRRAKTCASLFAMAGLATALGDCVPDDASAERSTVEVTMETSVVGLVTGVQIDRVIVSASATIPDCHLIYFVERPHLPLILVNLQSPYVIQHRSVSNSSCKVLAGFSDLTGEPSERDVTDEERAFFYSPERGVTAGIAISAKITYRGVEKEIRPVLTALRGTSSAFVELRPGERNRLRATLSLQGLFRGSSGASLLPFLVQGDRNDDGVVDSDELSKLYIGEADDALGHMKKAAAAAWSLVEIPSGRDAGAKPFP